MRSDDRHEQGSGDGARSGCGCGGGGGGGGCSGGCGSGCTCTGAPAGTVCVRPQFFGGMLLTEDDLQAIIDYVVAKRRLTNRSVFGAGVVCGLDVTCDPCDVRRRSWSTPATRSTAAATTSW